MADNTETNRKAPSDEVQQLADLLNGLSARPAVETAGRAPAELREPAVLQGISEREILQQLLENNRNNPEIVQRLRQDFVKNDGKLR